MTVYRKIGLTALLVAAAAVPLHAQQGQDLATISLDSLLHVRISAAVRYDQTTAEAPSSVTILTAGDIRRAGYRTLNEVLAAVPGFYVASDRNYDYVGVRGFGRPTDYNNRVLLTLNGHPINDGFYGFAPVGTDLGIVLESLERIEIVRGPGSSLYGPNAMFAVVNLVTRPGTSIDGVEAHQEAGTSGLWRTWAMAGGRLGRTGSFQASGEVASDAGENLYFPEYDSAATNHGVARGLDGDQHRNILAQVQFGGFSLAGRASYRDKHIPTGAWETVFGDPRARTTDEWEMLLAGWQSRLGDRGRLGLSAAYDRYVYRGFYPAEDYLQRDGNDVTRLMTEGQLVWDLRADNRVIIGGDLRDHPQAAYWSRSETEVWYDGDFPYREWSVFAQDEQHLGSAVSLFAGLRYDRSSIQGGRTTPRAAVIVTPSRGTVIKLLYGEAFRGASIYEQYYYEDGHPVAGPLKPEVARTAELTLERQVARVARLSLSAFTSRVSDLIDTWQLPDGSEQFANRDRASTEGIEAELVARWPTGHLARVSYTHTLARDPVRDADLSNSPADIGRLSAVAALPRRSNLATEVRCESGRITLQGTRTGAFCVTDLNLRAEQLAFGFGGSVRITNAFDRDWMVPGGYEHRQAAIVQQGRQLVISLGYRFDRSDR